jgi:cytochrome c oxidase cbb3-type subunit 3
MSDFINEGFSLCVAIATLLGIVACAAFLFYQSKQKVRLSNHVEDNTTGHVWDEDLQELNNPMPRWWMWLFYITVVFGLVYLFTFPGLGSYEGKNKWTSGSQYVSEVKQLDEQVAPIYAQFSGKPIEVLAASAKAVSIGENLFLNNCAQCHGSDARGSKGFPNLTDSDWLYGGDSEAIHTSIAQGRKGMMPPMIDAIGGEESAKQVAQYVLSLSGRESDSVKAQLGREKFTQVCAACHGADAKGNVAIGAPNLSDRIWLHGGTEAAILETIRKGRTNEMPAHANKLTATQIDVLAAYVWQLSHRPAKVAQNTAK